MCACSILAVMGLATLSGGSGVLANTDDTVSTPVDVSNSYNFEGENEISPLIYHSGITQLVKSRWIDVTSSNNLFADYPIVTNDANNAGGIYVRVLNEAGAIIVPSTYVARGTSVQLGKIPANSGRYTIQATPLQATGYYYITID